MQPRIGQHDRLGNVADSLPHTLAQSPAPPGDEPPPTDVLLASDSGLASAPPEHGATLVGFAGAAPPDLLPRERLAAILALAPPFSELPPNLQSLAFQRMEPVRFAPGDFLLRQSSDAPHLLVVVEGTADVLLSDPPSGQGPRRLARVGPATVLGEISLMTFEPCTADVVALGYVDALAMPAVQFRDLVARYPLVGPPFSRLIAERLGGRVDALSGKQLQRYRIRRCVGQGGMGVVYEACDEARGRRVALKMMSHRLAYNVRASERFQREVEIGQTLDHPNVLKVYEWFMAFNTQFMALEYCDGWTAHMLARRRHRLTQDDVRRLLGQLAAGLAEVHARGYVHRDLKPANVMIDTAGVVKLTDFGLARSSHAGDLTVDGELLGTLRYMAPEQFLGGDVDAAADVYALGCLAYELLAAKPLFRSHDVLEMAEERMHWRLPPPEAIRRDLQPDLYELLTQSLADDPAARQVDLVHCATWAAPLDVERLFA